MKNNIQLYSKLSEGRNLLKRVQQLSWNITQLDRKYPLEDIKEEDYLSILATYLSFNSELQGIAESFEDFKERVSQNENKLNELKNESKGDPH